MSRPGTFRFYEALPPESFPVGVSHAERVHSGLYIFNHRTDQVEDVIEGAFNRGNLVVLRNRQQTINKLQNTGELYNSEEKLVQGHWKRAYDIKTVNLFCDAEYAASIFNQFEREFKTESDIKPIPFIAGYLDSQTCAHYLRIQIKRNEDTLDGTYPSPYEYVSENEFKNEGEPEVHDCTLGWKQGGKSPMALRRLMESGDVPEVKGRRLG